MIKIKDGFAGERSLMVPQSISKELITNNLYSSLNITDIGYYPKAQFHFREREQPIDQNILIWCTEGQGWYKINNQEFKVKTNQYFIIKAGFPHSYGSDNVSPWTIYWIHFKGNLASSFIDNATGPIDIPLDHNSRINERIDIFEEIFHTLEMGYSHENLLYSSSLLCHFLASLRFVQQFRNATEKSDDKVDAITITIHFMKEHIEKKLTLQEIAENVGYSPSYISTLFNKRTGFSPITYFNQLKIQKACQLLDLTDMKINQICYKVGIDDCYYFSRLFNKIIGMSPNKYKQIKKG